MKQINGRDNSAEEERGMRSEGDSWMDLTPETAAKWLARGVKNRPINKANLAAITADMAAGRWGVTAEPIIHTVSGEMIDGQHRCMGVVASGKTIRFKVIFDAPDGSFRYMGRGKIRTGADLLAIHGYPNSVLLTAVLAMIKYYLSGYKTRTGALYGDELLAAASAWPEAGRAIELCRRKSELRVVSTAPIVAAVALFLRVDADDAGAFVEDLAVGAVANAADPVMTLRRRLISDMGSKARLSREYVFALAIKAWEARRSGKEVKRSALRVRTAGPQQEDGPRVTGLAT